MGEAFEELTDASQEHLPALQGAASFAARLPAIKRIAEALKDPAAHMDLAANEFLAKVETVGAMIDVIAELRRSGEMLDQDSEGLGEFTDSMSGLADSASEAGRNFTEMLGTVRQMRRWSNLLKPVSRSLEHSLNTILRGIALTVEWPGRLQGDGAEGD